jgi:hypothetical protein
MAVIAGLIFDLEHRFESHFWRTPTTMDLTS